MIVKMGHEFGGTAFNNPEGPIYPNSEWHPHVCDQDLVRQRKMMPTAARVREDFPDANVQHIDNSGFRIYVGHNPGDLGFVILGEQLRTDVDGGSYLVISENHTFYESAEAAWEGAIERIKNGLPTWQIDMRKFGVHSKTNIPSESGLDSLPQIPKGFEQTIA